MRFAPFDRHSFCNDATGYFFPGNQASIAIVTAYPGASAETVQGFVTEPIERVASSVPGLDYVESVTTAGVSTVTLWLRLNRTQQKSSPSYRRVLAKSALSCPRARKTAIEISRPIRPTRFISGC